MANPEGIIQRNLIKWARSAEKDWDGLWKLHSVPNGYKMGKPRKNKAGKWINPSAGIAKSEGLLSGVWDLCMPVRKIIFNDPSTCKMTFMPGCYLETKQGEYYCRYEVMQKKNPNQIIWGEAMELEGWQTLVYHDWTVAAGWLCNYLAYGVLTESEQEDAWQGFLRYRDAMALANERLHGRIY